MLREKGTTTTDTSTATEGRRAADQANVDNSRQPIEMIAMNNRVPAREKGLLFLGGWMIRQQQRVQVSECLSLWGKVGAPPAGGASAAGKSRTPSTTMVQLHFTLSSTNTSCTLFHFFIWYLGVYIRSLRECSRVHLVYLSAIRCPLHLNSPMFAHGIPACFPHRMGP